MVAAAASPRVMSIQSVSGAFRYVKPWLFKPTFANTLPMQAKSGYKTRKKNKPNKWVVTERPRNQGKRRKAKRS
jgi:hypothetical protein